MLDQSGLTLEVTARYVGTKVVAWKYVVSCL
jgi:hypothetical protein